MLGFVHFFLPFQVSLNKEPETCAATRATVACVAKRYRFDRFQSIQSIGHHSDQNCFPPTAQSYGVFSPLSVPERPMLLGTIPKRKCCSRRIFVPRLNMSSDMGFHESRVHLPSFSKWDVALRFI